MNKHFFITAFLLALCLVLTGCGDNLLERSYSSVMPHSAAYWENGDEDTLRAENYQDLVNALLILLDEHSENGVVRIYGDYPNKARMAESACVEAQKETAIGAYLLDYITYTGKEEGGCYELTVRFRYRRTAEEQEALVNATSTEALPDLLRAAVQDGADAVAIRIGWFGTDRAGVLSLIEGVHREAFPPEDEETEPQDTQTPEDGTEAAESEPPEEPPAAAEEGEGGEAPETDGAEPEEPSYDIAPWEVFFYPDDVSPGIIEVRLKP